MHLAEEIARELESILNYWEINSLDYEHGGFVGRRDSNNRLIKGAEKGSVLNARILWTFSAAFQTTVNPLHKELADRAYVYIKEYFIDDLYGGVFWTVDFEGKPSDTKKQIYALAFTAYALSEYYKIERSEQVLDVAVSLFRKIEEHAFDPLKGGYIEAFSREWQELDDIRLSEKDSNEKKTMNTHLHVLEAYTNLYSVWKDPLLEKQLRALLHTFDQYIIDKSSYHLILFMDENWKSNQRIISFGHDIEASWLLLEAAETLSDEILVKKFEHLAVKMADAAAEGLDSDGSLLYELNIDKHHLNSEKHWWVQAEAMVGFFNVWQLSGEKKYWNIVSNLWVFVKDAIVDNENGEWHWGRAADMSVMSAEDKMGLWKCPYHNTRACFELLRRIEKSLSSNEI